MTAAVQSMLADRPGFDPDPAAMLGGGARRETSSPAPSGGGLFRWVRQRAVPAVQVWRPWWLLGLVEVVTYPRSYSAQPLRRHVLPAMRAVPEFGLPGRSERVLLVAT